MLRTTIQTTDETGRELPIPPDLLEKVRRADDTLKEVLDKVGEKFNIKARWWFDRGAGQDFDVLLSLWTEGMPEQGGLFLFPKADLEDADTTRGAIRKAIRLLFPHLSAQVDRDFARLRQDLEVLVATPADVSED